MTLLERTYAAFNARDIDGALAAMHPDVDWPNGMEGGRVHGHRAVREYWTRQWGLIDPRVEPRGFATEADGRIAVDVHQVVRDRAGAIAFAMLPPTRAWIVAVARSPCSLTATTDRSEAVPEVCSRTNATQLDVFRDWTSWSL